MKNNYNSIKEQASNNTPLFPIAGMPEDVQYFVNEMHGIYGTPIDYWAGAAIMAYALAIGDKITLKTKYENNPILWGAFVGDVSNGKTEPLDLCTSFFRKSDSESIEKYNNDTKEYESFMQTPKAERSEIIERPDTPYMYLLNDFTPEFMADAHRINSRGIMIYRDELKGWLDDFGRYSKSGEQSNMLTAWSQKAISYGRKSGAIINIKKPCIYVAGGIHRELLHTLATDNRAENGFLARLINFFPDNAEKQPYTNKKPDEALIASWNNSLSALARMEEHITISLGDKSHALYEEWYNQNVKEINKEPTPYLKGVYGKLDIICLRLAIVVRGMFFNREGSKPIYILPNEMQTAIEMTEYFRLTAKKVYNQIYGEQSFGRFDKKAAIQYLQKNHNIPKTKIAEMLETSRSQIDRVLKY